MTRILVASGGHKHVLGPVEACEAIGQGLQEALPRADLTLLPMADGGDGTMDALVHAHGGTFLDVSVRDPLFRLISARMGIYNDSQGQRTAVLEIAQAAGSALLKPHERLTMVATSYGVGELLLHAHDQGCRRIVVGLGGSIVSDMGLGMAQALGFAFLDARNREVTATPGGGLNALAMGQVTDIRWPSAGNPFADSEIIVASDANIPLLGPQGQAAVFGPQKGATPSQVAYLERGFWNMAEVLRQKTGVEVDQPYAGAAGGLGAGLLGFLGVRLLPGAALVANILKLQEKLDAHDWVIVGEGRHDATTWLEKAPFYVARQARAMGKPVACVAGTADQNGARDCYDFLLTCSGNGLDGVLEKHLAQAGLRSAAVQLATCFPGPRGGTP